MAQRKRRSLLGKAAAGNGGAEESLGGEGGVEADAGAAPPDGAEPPPADVPAPPPEPAVAGRPTGDLQPSGFVSEEPAESPFVTPHAGGPDASPFGGGAEPDPFAHHDPFAPSSKDPFAASPSSRFNPAAQSLPEMNVPRRSPTPTSDAPDPFAQAEVHERSDSHYSQGAASREDTSDDGWHGSVFGGGGKESLPPGWDTQPTVEDLDGPKLRAAKAALSTMRADNATFGGDEPPTEEVPSAMMEDRSSAYGGPMNVPEPPPIPGLFDRFTPPPVAARGSGKEFKPADGGAGGARPRFEATPSPSGLVVEDTPKPAAASQPLPRVQPDDEEEEAEAAPSGPPVVMIAGVGMALLAAVVLGLILVVIMNGSGDDTPPPAPPQALEKLPPTPPPTPPPAPTDTTTTAPTDATAATPGTTLPATGDAVTATTAPATTAPTTTTTPATTAPATTPPPATPTTTAPKSTTTAPSTTAKKPKDTTAKPAPAPTPSPAAVGTLKIRSNRRVLVKVNGQPRDYSPLDLPMSAGSYTISAALPGKPESEQKITVDLKSGAIEPVNFTF